MCDSPNAITAGANFDTAVTAQFMRGISALAWPGAVTAASAFPATSFAVSVVSALSATAVPKKDDDAYEDKEAT